MRENVACSLFVLNRGDARAFQPQAVIVWQVEEAAMPDKDKRKPHDSISVVGPYARVRAVVAVIIILFAIGVIGYRAFFG